MAVRTRSHTREYRQSRDAAPHQLTSWLRKLDVAAERERADRNYEALVAGYVRQALRQVVPPPPSHQAPPSPPSGGWHLPGPVQVTIISGTAHAWVAESRRGRQTCLACGERFKQPAQKTKRTGLCAACRDGYGRLRVPVELVA